jgi:hypothetical protein
LQNGPKVLPESKVLHRKLLKKADGEEARLQVRRLVSDTHVKGCVHLAPFDTRDSLNDPAPFDHHVYSYKYFVDSNTLGEEKTVGNYLLIS